MAPNYKNKSPSERARLRAEGLKVALARREAFYRFLVDMAKVVAALAASVAGYLIASASRGSQK